MQKQGKFVHIGVAALAGFLTVLVPAAAQMGSDRMRTPDGGTSSSGSPMPGGASYADRSFVKEAAQGGMAEVQLGQLAVQNAMSPEVKAFGQRMVDDHSKANDHLKQVAASMSYTLPDSISSGDKAEADRLSKMTGADFDKAYIRYMVKDHKADVQEFKREAMKGGGNAKMFASSILPTLEEHLKMAEDLQAKLGG